MGKIWHYAGPVKHFGKIVTYSFDEYTVAPTIGKAMSNLCYKFKMQNGYQPNTKIEIDRLYLKEEEIG